MLFSLAQYLAAPALTKLRLHQIDQELGALVSRPRRWDLGLNLASKTGRYLPLLSALRPQLASRTAGAGAGAGAGISPGLGQRGILLLGSIKRRREAVLQGGGAEAEAAAGYASSSCTACMGHCSET